MTDASALMSAILDHPNELTPKLAYADLLDERGQPGDPERAELIRVQCGVGSSRSRCCSGEAFVYNEFGGYTDCPKCLGTGDRARELLLSHASEWFADAVPGAHASHWTPHRAEPYFVLPGGSHFVNVTVGNGFINQVSLRASVFAGEGIRCDHCIDGSPDWETGVIECRRCDSTGVIFEPCAAELFERHPLVRVMLYDRVPEAGLSGTAVWSARRDNDRSDRPHFLPWDLFLHLTGGEHTGPGERTRERHPEATWLYCRIYPTAADAHADLNAACLAYGRQLVDVMKAGAA